MGERGECHSSVKIKYPAGTAKQNSPVMLLSKVEEGCFSRGERGGRRERRGAVMQQQVAGNGAGAIAGNMRIYSNTVSKMSDQQMYNAVALRVRVSQIKSNKGSNNESNHNHHVNRLFAMAINVSRMACVQCTGRQACSQQINAKILHHHGKCHSARQGHKERVFQWYPKWQSHYWLMSHPIWGRDGET